MESSGGARVSCRTMLSSASGRVSGPVLSEQASSTALTADKAKRNRRNTGIPELEGSPVIPHGAHQALSVDFMRLSCGSLNHLGSPVSLRVRSGVSLQEPPQPRARD